MRIQTTLGCFLLLVTSALAQPDSLLIPPEEDFSKYADVEEAPTKRYCTSKVLGISPSRLITLAYDFQGSNTLNAGALEQFASEKADIHNNHGLRFAANFPVISNMRWLLNLGVNYLEHKYSFRGGAWQHPLQQSLMQNGLRSYGFNATLFKPFNETYFSIVQGMAELNGDLALSDVPSLNQTKLTASLIVGKKYHDRLMAGIGLSRAYRGGELIYVPVLLYNYTSPGKKWGIEALLPVRAHFRYTLNARNMLFAGFELEGTSYRLNNLMQANPNLVNRNIELRRSELRPRIVYDFSLYHFIWVSVQAGYRINFRNALDEGEFYRSSFGKEIPYLSENKLSNTWYGQISINLVSP
jgi:hypothetical protein